jgi:Carboxypeptidase regulatory-like domain
MKTSDFSRSINAGKVATSTASGVPETAQTHWLGSWIPVCILLLMALAVCTRPVSAQMAGTGAISGTVTDPTGAVVANATVTATSVETNVKTVRTTTSAGDYNITPLTPSVYTVTVTAAGFQTYQQKNVTVDALQTVAVNAKLTVGGTDVTVTVSEAPPMLETTDAQIGGVMDNEMYSSLPLLMGASGQPDQRRATDFAYLMPGVQNTYAASAGGNPTDASGAANGGNPAGGTSEIYIDGINLPEGDGVGDVRYTWTAIGVDAVNQFQVETAGYSAQYAGQGVQNFSVKSGGNQIHGSVYEFFRNTALDAWLGSGKTPTLTGAPVPQGGACNSVSLTSSTPWCALGGIKPAEHMNEAGIVIGGPIIKNKLFLFYNYGTYRYAAGPTPHTQTIPTLAMLGYSSPSSALGYADYSGYALFNGPSTGTNPCTTSNVGTQGGPCYDVYDPGSQTVQNCTTSACQRTVFPNDHISSSRFSTASNYINQFMLPYSAQANQSFYSNNLTIGYPSGLSNWYQTGRLDYDASEVNRISLIVAFGRQSVAGGYNLAGGASNALPPPFNGNQFYAPTTTVDILRDTYTINAHLVNQAAFAYGRYKSLDSNQNDKSIYSAAATGLLNTPPGQATVGFPGISFSGGVDAPANEGGYNWHGQVNNSYTAMDNLQWQHGKHNVTLGGQSVAVQFNSWTTDNSTPLTYTFSANQTEGYNSAGSGLTSGSSVASYMLGAVSSSSVSISPEWGARWFSPSFWAQDDYKVTSKLTLNLGLRWDLFGSIHEAHNQMTWLNPSGNNLNTGNYGTLAFAGGTASNGPYTGIQSPSRMWYKNIAPRIGLAYSMDAKTVIRASYDVAYARGNWTAGGGGQKLPSQMGLIPSASAPAGVSNAPSFYWDASSCTSGVARDGFTPCGWTGSVSTPAIVIAQQIAAGNMPAGATLANFGTAETALEKNSNNGSPAYFDPYLGSRSPEYINWTLGIQRAVTKNMTATVTYVGSQGHFISVSGANYQRSNGLSPSLIPLAGYALTSATATTATPCTGAGCLYSLIGQKATTTNLALAQGYGFIPPNPFSSPGNYYASNSVYQYYSAFPQYSGVSDQTSFVGNENWNALEVSVRQRLSSGLNFMVNYTWSKSIDDLGTFRESGNNRLDRTLSAADQPQSVSANLVYALPVGRGHWLGDNAVYRSIVSDWTVSAIGTAHSGLPILVTGSGCAGSGILGTCMPSVVPGQRGRQNAWGKTASGAAVSWDPNNANYIGKVGYINPAAFTVLNAGTCTAGTATPYHSQTQQAYYVCNGPEDFVPGTAARTAPMPGLWTQPSYNVDLGIRRSFPIFREWKLQFGVDMTNVTNHVIYAGPGTLSVSSTSDNVGNFAVVSKINNYPRDVQLSARINW